MSTPSSPPVPPPPPPHPRRRAALRLLDGLVLAALLAHGAGRLQVRLRAGPPPPLPPPLRVDVASAPYEHLVLLPGVGPTRARAILEDRETHGPIRVLGDLVRVPGIGAATVQGLRAATDVRVVVGPGPQRPRR